MPYENFQYGGKCFVGRQQEFTLFQRLLDGQKTDAWIFNIQGKGGIGKSLLLENFIKRLVNKKKAGSEILFTPIPIDLAITAHQISIGILKTLTGIAPEHFNDYNQELTEYIDSHPSGELARERLKKLYQEFIDIYAQLQAQHIILFFDTVEQINFTEHNFLTEFLPELKKINPATFIVAAGRPHPQPNPYYPFDRLDKLKIHHYILKPLSTDDTESYFKGQLSDELTMNIAPKTLENLVKLSEGRPILIALIIDCLVHDDVAEEFTNIKPEEFERRLIEHITVLHNPDNIIILAMAHLYRRFNPDILFHVINNEQISSLTQAEEQIDSLIKFSFVKYSCSTDDKVANCVLHDEMRYLIKKYLLDESQDHDGFLRKSWNKKIIDYYHNLINSQKNMLERHYFECECLYYSLQLDIQKGFDYWDSLFQQAVNYDIKESLNNELEYFENHLKPEQKITYKYSKIKIIFDRGNYQKAATEMDNLLNQKSTYCSVELQAEVRAQRILAYAMIAELKKAKQLIKEDSDWFTSQSSRNQNNEKFKFSWGKFNNSVGYVYRIDFDASKAATHYEKALEIYSQLNTIKFEKDIATTRTNLAYAYDFLGKADEAYAQCSKALKIKKKLEQPYDLGLAYNVRGLLEANAQQFPKAFKYFELALDEFEKAKSQRGKALSLLAHAKAIHEWKWQQLRPNREPGEIIQEYRTALGYLKDAKVLFSNTDKTQLTETIQQIGRLHREQGHWDTAIKSFEESLNLAESEEINNLHFQASNSKDLAITYYEIYKKPLNSALTNEVGLNEILLKARSYANKAIELGKNANNFHIVARAQRIIVNILCENQEYKNAFNMLEKSISNLLKTDPNNTQNYITRKLYFHYWHEWLDSFIEELPENQKKECCKFLLEKWKYSENYNYHGFITIIEISI